MLREMVTFYFSAQSTMVQYELDEHPSDPAVISDRYQHYDVVVDGKIEMAIYNTLTANGFKQLPPAHPIELHWYRLIEDADYPARILPFKELVRETA